MMPLRVDPDTIAEVARLFDPRPLPPRCSCCGRLATVVVVCRKGDLEARRQVCDKDARTIAARAIKLRYADTVSVVAA